MVRVFAAPRARQNPHSRAPRAPDPRPSATLGDEAGGEQQPPLAMAWIAGWKKSLDMSASMEESGRTRCPLRSQQAIDVDAESVPLGHPAITKMAFVSKPK